MEQTKETLRRVRIHRFPSQLQLHEGLLSGLCALGGIAKLDITFVEAHGPRTLAEGIQIAADGTATMTSAETHHKPYVVKEETREGDQDLVVYLCLYLRDIDAQRELLKWNDTARTLSWLLNWYLLDALATTNPRGAVVRQLGWKILQLTSPLVSVITPSPAHKH